MDGFLSGSGHTLSFFCRAEEREKMSIAPNTITLERKTKKLKTETGNSLPPTTLAPGVTASTLLDVLAWQLALSRIRLDWVPESSIARDTIALFGRIGSRLVVPVRATEVEPRLRDGANACATIGEFSKFYESNSILRLSSLDDAANEAASAHDKLERLTREHERCLRILTDETRVCSDLAADIEPKIDKKKKKTRVTSAGLDAELAKGREARHRLRALQDELKVLRCNLSRVKNATETAKTKDDAFVLEFIKAVRHTTPTGGESVPLTPPPSTATAALETTTEPSGQPAVSGDRKADASPELLPSPIPTLIFDMGHATGKTGAANCRLIACQLSRRWMDRLDASSPTTFLPLQFAMQRLCKETLLLLTIGFGLSIHLASSTPTCAFRSALQDVIFELLDARAEREGVAASQMATFATQWSSFTQAYFYVTTDDDYHRIKTRLLEIECNLVKMASARQTGTSAAKEPARRARLDAKLAEIARRGQMLMCI